jgi:4-amino-4-deoxy-L-arabinose transferase-like glycosyltransferase
VNEHLHKSKGRAERIFLIVLGVMLLINAANNYRMLQEDNNSISHDALNQYLSSRKYFEALKDADIPAYMDNYLLRVCDPPLIQYQALPFYVLMGQSIDTAAFSNIIHVIILVFSTYFIGRYLKGPAAGFISALIILALPPTLSYSRVYLPALSVASFFAMATAFLLYSDKFMKREFALLFGIAFAGGMLTKVTFIAYIFPLCMIYIGRYFIMFKTRINRQQLINIVIASFAVLLIAGPWYFLNAAAVQDNAENTIAYHNQTAFTGMSYDRILVEIAMSYWNKLREYVLMGFMLPMILSIIFCLYMKPKKDHVLSLRGLLINIPLTYLFFMSFPAMTRYLIPFLHVFSLCLGFAVADVSSAISRKVRSRYATPAFYASVIFAIAFLSVQAYSEISLIPYFGAGEEYAMGMPIVRRVADPPETVAEKIMELLPDDGTRKNILVLPAFYSIIQATDADLSQNMHTSRPLYCLRGTWTLEESYRRCVPSNLGREYFSGFDLVIFSDTIFSKADANKLEKSMVVRNRLAKSILDSWNQNEDLFELASVERFYFEEDAVFVNLSYYLKREDAEQ